MSPDRATWWHAENLLVWGLWFDNMEKFSVTHYFN